MLRKWKWWVLLKIWHKRNTWIALGAPCGPIHLPTNHHWHYFEVTPLSIKNQGNSSSLFPNKHYENTKNYVPAKDYFCFHIQFHQFMPFKQFNKFIHIPKFIQFIWFTQFIQLIKISQLIQCNKFLQFGLQIQLYK